MGVNDPDHDDRVRHFAKIDSIRKLSQNRTPNFAMNERKGCWMRGDALQKFLDGVSESSAEPRFLLFVPVARVTCFVRGHRPENDWRDSHFLPRSSFRSVGQGIAVSGLATCSAQRRSSSARSSSRSSNSASRSWSVKLAQSEIASSARSLGGNFSSSANSADVIDRFCHSGFIRAIPAHHSVAAIPPWYRRDEAKDEVLISQRSSAGCRAPAACRCSA